MNPATLALIEMLTQLIENAVPQIINVIQEGGMDPDTQQSYVTRLQTAMTNLPKPAGT